MHSGQANCCRLHPRSNAASQRRNSSKANLSSRDTRSIDSRRGVSAAASLLPCGGPRRGKPANPFAPSLFLQANSRESEAKARIASFRDRRALGHGPKMPIAQRLGASPRTAAPRRPSTAARRQAHRPRRQPGSPPGADPPEPPAHAAGAAGDCPGAFVLQLRKAGVERVVGRERTGRRPKGCNDVQRVPQPWEKLRRDHRPRAQFPQPRLKRRQRAPEIAAVDAGDVAGFGRFKRVRVVPVEKMSAMPLQALERVERAAGPFEQSRRGNIAQIVGGQVGQQAHADIRRAGAVSDHPMRMLLQVVRGQPVMFRADHRVKVVPGLPGPAAEIAHLPLRQPNWPARAAAAKSTMPPMAPPTTKPAPGQRTTGRADSPRPARPPSPHSPPCRATSRCSDRGSSSRARASESLAVVHSSRRRREMCSRCSVRTNRVEV